VHAAARKTPEITVAVFLIPGVERRVKSWA
jgi:hypothetical protein